MTKHERSRAKRRAVLKAVWRRHPYTRRTLYDWPPQWMVTDGAVQSGVFVAPDDAMKDFNRIKGVAAENGWPELKNK